MEQRACNDIVVCDAVAAEGGWEERASSGTAGVAAAMLDFLRMGIDFAAKDLAFAMLRLENC
jgi:hypothetical protein